MSRFLYAVACALFLLFILYSGDEKMEPPPTILPKSVLSIDTVSTIEPIDERIENVEKNARFIYFTIDDGPSKYSHEILETAQKMQVPMTVFLVGGNLWGREYPQFIDDYRHEPLIEMANHSFCHARNDYDHWYLNPDGVLRDFQKNQATFDFQNKLARLPGRAIWEIGERERCIFPTGKSSAEWLHKNGWTVFGWDVEWHFFHKTGAPKETAEGVLASIEKHIREREIFTENHVVLLLHERHFQQRAEVEQLISLLKNAGFQFRHLSDYPKKGAHAVS